MNYEFQYPLIHFLMFCLIQNLMTHIWDCLRLNIGESCFTQHRQRLCTPFGKAGAWIILSAYHQQRQVSLDIAVLIRLGNICHQMKQSIVAADCKLLAAERISGESGNIIFIIRELSQIMWLGIGDCCGKRSYGKCCQQSRMSFHRAEHSD